VLIMRALAVYAPGDLLVLGSTKEGKVAP
jgi:hypothetical protein